MHLAVEGQQATPPTAPTPGECWIVDASPTDEWSGHEGSLAVYTQGGWVYANPSFGMLAFDKQQSQFRRYDGSWSQATAPAQPQGGGVVDAEARTAINELINALRTIGILP